MPHSNSGMQVELLMYSSCCSLAPPQPPSTSFWLLPPPTHTPVHQLLVAVPNTHTKEFRKNLQTPKVPGQRTGTCRPSASIFTAVNERPTDGHKAKPSNLGCLWIGACGHVPVYVGAMASGSGSQSFQLCSSEEHTGLERKCVGSQSSLATNCHLLCCSQAVTQFGVCLLLVFYHLNAPQRNTFSRIRTSNGAKY